MEAAVTYVVWDLFVYEGVLVLVVVAMVVVVVVSE